MSTNNADTHPPACPGGNDAGAARHGAVHPSAVRLDLPRIGLYDQTTNSNSTSISQPPMKFEQGPHIKAEAKDEESEDYHHTTQQQQQQWDGTDPSTNMNTSMNMNQTMPLMDSEISLTVPMSRKNAAIITSTRLKRLKTLSSAKEEQLTGAQTAEKKRIIRLEKNRRAAAMSRKKKKVYIRDLEENSKLMERHLAILKMENDHLRALLAANMQQQAQQAQQMMAAQAQAQQGLASRSNSQSAPAPTTVPPSTAAQVTGLQAPPVMPPNPTKRRRLNDGSAATSTNTSTAATTFTSAATTAATTAATSLSPSDDDLSMDTKDVQQTSAPTKEKVIEKQEVGALPPPPPPPSLPLAMNPVMSPMMHPMAMMQRLRMMPNMFSMPMHPQMPINPAMNPMMMAQMSANQPMPPPPTMVAQTMAQTIPQMQAQLPKVELKSEPKVEVVSEQKEDSPDKLMPMPLPPSVLGAGSDNEEFGVLPFLDESIIEEEIDECGGIEGFEAADNGFVI